jgi:hypothetical protein
VVTRLLRVTTSLATDIESPARIVRHASCRPHHVNQLRSYNMPRLAALAGFLFIACGGRAVETSGSSGTGARNTTVASGAGGGAAVCDQMGTPGACAACCEQKNPAAKPHFDVAIGDCVCSTCSPTCRESVCTNLATPSDACLPCVQASLGSDTCQIHAGLFESACLSEPSCDAYVRCLLSCPS